MGGDDRGARDDLHPCFERGFAAQHRVLEDEARFSWNLESAGDLEVDVRSRLASGRRLPV